MAWRCLACGKAVSERQGEACPHCGDWNTLQEEDADEGAGPLCVPLASYREQPVERWSLFGLKEWHDVLGGGLAKGSSVLVYGKPGSRKTTDLLRMATLVPGSVYCAQERGQGPGDLLTLAARCELVIPRDLYVIKPAPFRDVCAALAARRRSLVVFDSLAKSLVGDLAEAWRDLRDACPGATLVAIVRATKLGDWQGSADLGFDVDTIIQAAPDALHCPEKNRYGVAPLTIPRAGVSLPNGEAATQMQVPRQLRAGALPLAPGSAAKAPPHPKGPRRGA